MFGGAIMRLLVRWTTLLVIPLLAASAWADSVLYVTSSDGSVKRYDGATGTFIDTFLPAGSSNAQGVAVGANGDLYVPYSNTEVRRYDGQTGADLGTFATGFNNLPRGVGFGPNGNLYGINATAHTIREHDATTGAFVRNAASSLSSSWFFTFGPDGMLYVSDNGVFNRVSKYDPTSGAFLSIFVPNGAGGLTPSDFKGGLEFGPDGNLYWAIGGNPLSSGSTDAVYRFNGTTGAFIDIFVADGSGGLRGSEDLHFGPDGNLYVASYATNSIMRYDGMTGAFIDSFVTSGSGGLSNPRNFAFYTTPVPEPQALILLIVAALGLVAWGRQRPL